MGIKCFAHKNGDCTILLTEASREMKRNGFCGKIYCPFYKPTIECVRKESNGVVKFIKDVNNG